MATLNRKQRRRLARKVTSVRDKRCVTYLRCSTDEQHRDKEYSTIDAQNDRTRRYIAEEGGVFVGQYADPGKSGTIVERADADRLLKDAESGLFDCVVVTFLSRLGRGEAFTVLNYHLQRAGVAVISVNEQFAAGAAGRTMRNVTVVMDGAYVEQVTEHTIATMTELFHQGYHVGGRIPFGFASVDAGIGGRKGDRMRKRLAPDLETAPFVVEAYHRFLTSRSLADVRSYLESVTGKSWFYNMTRQLLTSRYYLGEAQWGEENNPAAHPSIVEAHVFEAVQEILSGDAQRRARKPDENARDPHHYHLRGILTCSCGTHMTTDWGTSHTGARMYYYKCKNRDCDARLSINAAHIHVSLLTEFDRCARHPWRVRQHIERAIELMPGPDTYAPQITAVESRLKKATKTVNGLTVAVASAPPAALNALLRRVDAEETARAELESELSRLRVEAARAHWRPTVADLTETMGLFTQIWERENSEMRTALMVRLVERARLWDRKTVEVTVLPIFAVSEEKGSDTATIEGGYGSNLRTTRHLRVPLLIEISRSPKIGGGL